MQMKRVALVVGLLTVVSAAGILFAPAAASGKNVLIYGPSMGQILTPEWTYNEATIASDLGHTVTVADPQTWVAMTEAEFAAFDAIVFGDPKCGVGTLMLEPADHNKAVWSPVITGPTIVIGTTPQLYQFAPNAEDRELIANGISFVLSGTGTGLYVSLACYYAQATPNTPVGFLSEVGDFQLAGREGCTGEVTIVNPDHPAMAGLTSLGQPVGQCATQELLSAYPSSLEVLATALRPSDGAHLPFIVATPVAIPSDPPEDPPYDDGSYLPFAHFSAEVECEDDEFEVEGTFTLGEGNDGINPLSEDVTVTLGENSLTIPAGSFDLEDDDEEYEFEGTIDGVEFEMEIEHEEGDTFEFEVEFEGDDINGCEESIHVALVIGDDEGSTAATGEHEDDDEDDEDESDDEEYDEDDQDDEDESDDGDDDEDEDDEDDDEDDNAHHRNLEFLIG